MAALQGEGISGAQLAGRAVVFQTSSEATTGPVRFRLNGSGSLKILVADLAPGRWRVLRDGAVVESAREVSSEAGVLWLEGPPGSYELRR